MPYALGVGGGRNVQCPSRLKVALTQEGLGLPISRRTSKRPSRLDVPGREAREASQACRHAADATPSKPCKGGCARMGPWAAVAESLACYGGKAARLAAGHVPVTFVQMVVPSRSLTDPTRSMDGPDETMESRDGVQEPYH